MSMKSVLDAQQWLRLKSAFAAIVESGIDTRDPELLRAAIDAVCGEDPGIASELSSLLEHEDRNFLGVV